MLAVHVISGYVGLVVLGPEEPVPSHAVNRMISEMGINGLDIVVHGDQENLLEKVFKDAAKLRTFVGRSLHWVPFAVGRPQSKGIVERNIGLIKEAFWSVWLGLEERVGEKLALGGDLFAEALRYAVRMHNLFHCSKALSTPLERLRGATVQPVKTCEFGVVGFGKPQRNFPEHRGKRLVRCIYVGPNGANGSGVRAFVPLSNLAPRLELFSAFRPKEPLEIDVPVLKVLCGNREDPERPILFEVEPDEPRQEMDGEPVEFPPGSIEFPRTPQEDSGPMPLGNPDEEELPYEPTDDEHGPPVPLPEGMELDWPQGLVPPEAGGNNMDVEDPDTMDVDLVEGDELLIRGIQWLEEFGLRLLFEGPDLRVRTTKPPPCEIEAWLRTVFCGKAQHGVTARSADKAGTTLPKYEKVLKAPIQALLKPSLIPLSQRNLA